MVEGEVERVSRCESQRYKIDTKGHVREMSRTNLILEIRGSTLERMKKRKLASTYGLTSVDSRVGQTGGFEVLLDRGFVWEDCTMSQFEKERDSIEGLTL